MSPPRRRAEARPSAPRPPADQAVRERVVREVDLPTVLDAGAGSGKTSVIVDRIVELVLSDRAPLARVAAITFTRAAAASLRLRLRERLEQVVAGGEHARRPVDAAAQARARAALGTLDAAAITTIHAFCLRLLAERPVEARLEPGSTMLDEEAQAELLREAWRRLLGALDQDPERRRELLALRAGGLAEPAFAADEDDDPLFAAACAVARNRDLSPVGDPSPAALAPRLDRLRPLRDELAAGLERCTDPAAGALEVWQANLRRLDELLGDPETARARLQAWGEKSPLRKNRGQKGAWRPPETLARLRELADEATAVARAAHAELLVELHGRALRLLAGPGEPSFVGQYAALKREAAALDFQDLLLGTRRLLAAPDGPRRELAARYPYLLIDEFQDTDPLQVEVAELLAGLGGEPETPAAGRGTLFVVGDPQQSIYRFRRADLASYLRFAARVEQHGGRLERLSVGFRNAPALLRWINGTFGALLPAGAGAPGEAGAAYRPIDAHREETPGPALHVLPLPDDGRSAGTVDADAVLEARLLANLLHEWLTGARPLTVWDDDGPRPCRPGDFMVLVRRTAKLPRFQEAFARRGIPASFEGGRGFFARVEVQAVLAGLRAALDPADDHATAAALRSLLVAASDVQLAEWALCGRPRPTPAARSSTDPVERALARLAELHRLAHEQPPAAVVRALVAAFQLDEPLELLPGGAARAGNVAKVAALAEGFAGAGLAALRTCVRELQRRVDANAAEPELALDDPTELVQVTTIHRAKGLERPVVVLADQRAEDRDRFSLIPCRAADGAGHGELLVRIGRLAPRGWDAAVERESAAQADEALRLLYVACTRPRDHLLLVVPRASVPPGTFITPLLAHLPDPGVPGVHEVYGAAVEVLAPDELDVELPAPALPLDEDRLERAVRATGARRGAGPDAAELAARRGVAPVRAVTATTLAAESAPPSPPSVGGRGRLFGSLVHRLLHAAGPDFAPPSPELAERLAAAAGAAPGELAAALAAVRRAAADPLLERARRARRVLRELPVTWSRPAAADRTASPVVVHGVLDLAFEEADGWVIVDYKTDPVPDAATRDAREAHYRPQLGLYAEALAAAGLRVKESRLLFLGEDLRNSPGNVY
jgi:ATP-dependent helicase/nuclease subunit A